MKNQTQEPKPKGEGPMITYTGRNGTDLLLAADAKEMEEDFDGSQIILTLRNDHTLTLNRGDSLACMRDACKVLGPDGREVVR